MKSMTLCSTANKGLHVFISFYFILLTWSVQSWQHGTKTAPKRGMAPFLFSCQNLEVERKKHDMNKRKHDHKTKIYVLAQSYNFTVELTPEASSISLIYSFKQS